LPGETVEQANERSERVRTDRSIVHDYERETYDYENATRIYLARVISRTSGSWSEQTLPSTKVRPMHALKGQLPSGDQTLTDEAQSGMCSDVGDGRGAWSQVDDLVVVFEGLPKSEYRPRGVDSFRAQNIRTVELLDRLRDYGKDLEL
jgi:hypothetical protein